MGRSSHDLSGGGGLGCNRRVSAQRLREGRQWHGIMSGNLELVSPRFTAHHSCLIASRVSLGK